MSRDHVALAVCALMVLSSSAGAQVLQPPSRPSGGLFGGGGPPPDPNRTHQEVTLEVSVLGGYDDNLTPPNSGDIGLTHPSGYIGFGDGTLRYMLGKEAHSLEVTGRSFMNTYRSAGIGPSYGGDERLRAQTTLGRRTHLEVGQDARYAPYFSLGLFGATPQAADAQNPENNTTHALSEGASWTNGASGSLTRQWTRRMGTNVQYSIIDQTYLHHVVPDSRTQAGSVDLVQSLTRRLDMHATYKHSDREFAEGVSRTLPIRSDTAEFGFQYQRRLSRTRQMSVSGGAGTMYVDTLAQVSRRPMRYWAPSGYGTIRFDIGRSWNLTGDYSRSLSVLQGIVPQAFVAHSGSISAGGLVQRWLETVVTTGYSNGAAGASVGGVLGSYDGYTGTAQLRFRLTRWWSSVVSVSRFQYRLNTQASQSLGVPPDMHRNSVRVGFSWLLPLYGSINIEAKAPAAPGN